MKSVVELELGTLSIRDRKALAQSQTTLENLRHLKNFAFKNIQMYTLF